MCEELQVGRDFIHGSYVSFTSSRSMTCITSFPRYSYRWRCRRAAICQVTIPASRNRQSARHARRVRMGEPEVVARKDCPVWTDGLEEMAGKDYQERTGDLQEMAEMDCQAWTGDLGETAELDRQVGTGH